MEENNFGNPADNPAADNSAQEMPNFTQTQQTAQTNAPSYSYGTVPPAGINANGAIPAGQPIFPNPYIQQKKSPSTALSIIAIVISIFAIGISVFSIVISCGTYAKLQDDEKQLSRTFGYNIDGPFANDYESSQKVDENEADFNGIHIKLIDLKKNSDNTVTVNYETTNISSSEKSAFNTMMVSTSQNDAELDFEDSSYIDPDSFNEESGDFDWHVLQPNESKNESETFALKDGKSDVTVTVYDFMTSKTRIMHEYKIS